MKFSEIMKEAHATALEKGWHDGAIRTPERALSLVALVHAEVVETQQDIPRPNGRAAELFWINDSGPGGVLVELADIIIRLADMHAFFGWETLAELRVGEPAPPAFVWTLADVPKAIAEIHMRLAVDYTEPIRRNGRPDGPAPGALICLCEQLADSLALHFGAPATGLVEAVRAKMKHNKTRSYRHGGKLA